MADARSASSIEVGALLKLALACDPVLMAIIRLRIEGRSIADIARELGRTRQLVGDVLQAAELGAI